MEYSGARVANGCELPDVGAGNLVLFARAVLVFVFVICLVWF